MCIKLVETYTCGAPNKTLDGFIPCGDRDYCKEFKREIPKETCGNCTKCLAENERRLRKDKERDNSDHTYRSDLDGNSTNQWWGRGMDVQYGKSYEYGDGKKTDGNKEAKQEERQTSQREGGGSIRNDGDETVISVKKWKGKGKEL